MHYTVRAPMLAWLRGSTRSPMLRGERAQGKLTDGTVFDSSVTRGEPFTFTLGVGQVIKGAATTKPHTGAHTLTNTLINTLGARSLALTGWDKGLVGMCIGEKRRLRIPSEMAYGKSGSPPTIPPDAPLIFDVELIDIV